MNLRCATKFNYSFITGYERDDESELDIDKVVYPAGSYEKFQQGAAPTLSGHFSGQFDDFYSQGNRGVSTRRISADGTGQDEVVWSYGSGQSGSYPNNVPTRSVTAPDGSFTESRLHAVNSSDLILYGFDDVRTGLAFDERAYASPSVGGHILSRKLTEWQTDGQIIYSGNYQTHKTRNPRPAKEVNIIFDGSGTALATTTTYQYDADLNATVINRYNYATVDFHTAQNSSISQIPTGTLARIEETDYLTYNQAYRDRNMTALPTETRIKDASGNVVAKSQTLYDEPQYLESASITNAPGWENPNTPARGLPTTVRSWFDIPNNQYVETNTLYDQFGNVRKTWDGNDNVSEIQYVDNYSDSTNRNSYAFPTRTISPVPGGNGSTMPFEATVKYDFNTGLPTSTTDANGQTSTMEYNDPLLRPTKVTAPNGHQTITEYGAGTSASTRWVKSRSQIDSVNWKEGYSWYDGLGRTIKSQSVDAAMGDVFVETQYDNMGRVWKSTNPYRAGDTVYWTTNTFDSAGRPWKVTTPDGAIVETTYGLAASGSQLGTFEMTVDAMAKSRRIVEDAFDNLIRVDEPDSDGNLGMTSSPVRPTVYTYDTNENLTQIVQGGQTRTFGYDAMKRLTQAINPESGTFQFTYDGNGNLLVKSDARGITTTHTYDRLNRLNSKDYSGSTTADVGYYYDGTGILNSKNRLTKISSTASETLYTGFDSNGNITGSQQNTDGNTYTFGYTYNLDGDLVAQTYPSGKVVNFTYDPSGDLARISRPSGFTYASEFAYAPHGQVEKVRLGNGKWETTQFNSSRQITQIGLGNSATDTGIWKTNYEYGEWTGSAVDALKNNGSLAKQTTVVPTIGAVTGFTSVQTYTFDKLDRIKSATETIGGSQTWKQTFVYDRFGNKNYDTNNTTTLGSCASVVCNPTVSSATNRITSSGYSYDASGNIATDAEGRTFSYDAENRQITASGTNLSSTYSYDGNGKRVKSVNAVTNQTTIFVYDAEGKLAAEYTINVPAPAVPTISYLTEDALGSPRVITNSFAEVKARRDFFPFGEEIWAGYGSRTTNQKYSSNADDTRKKFATYQRDIETGLDFAQSRYYSPKHGRFTSPDEFKGGPDELFDFEEDASENPTFYAELDNPQSLNKYQYTYNNPYKYNDPNGHCPPSSPCPAQIWLTPRITPIIRPLVRVAEVMDAVSVPKIAPLIRPVARPLPSVDIIPPFTPIPIFSPQAAPQTQQPAQPQARPQPVQASKARARRTRDRDRTAAEKQAPKNRPAPGGRGRIKDGEDASDNVEGIRNAQRKNRKGIESIKKSEDRELIKRKEDYLKEKKDKKPNE